MVYHDDFLDATVPEIQRPSLAGTVLYLNSLDLADMDILKFDFLDSTSIGSLEDALKQLYLVDAIDENGSITNLGRNMAELPLEPSLSRTLLEANELDCLPPASINWLPIKLSSYYSTKYGDLFPVSAYYSLLFHLAGLVFSWEVRRLS